MQTLVEMLMSLQCAFSVTSWLFLPAAFILWFLLPRFINELWERYNMMLVSRNELQGLPVPPGTFGLPVVGETLSFLRLGSSFYKQKYEEYGPIYKTHLLGKPTIRVVGADNIKKILMGENSIVTQNWPLSARLLLGQGSISQSSGHAHSVRRKHIMHAFSMDTLCEYVPVIQETVQLALHDWTKRREFCVYPEVKRLAFSIAARTLIGIDMHNPQTANMHTTFTDMVANIMTIPFDIPGFGFRKGMKAKQRLIHDLKTLLPKTGERSYTPVMQKYYKSCEELDIDSKNPEQDFFEGVIDLLFAGHETVASSTTNCVMFLGQNDNAINNLREELNEHGLLCDNSDSEQMLTYKNIDDMKYLNFVIKEVLRLCPPAGGGFRRALKSFELGGYLIPKDWAIIYSIRETQHTSPLFHNPETFDPSRWEKISEDPNSERFHYVPFGAGARSCVGKMYAQLVLKIFVIELVKNYEWELKNKTPEINYIPIPVATDHLPIIFKTRD